ncbi:VanZ family protein [Fulvivirga sediminis]|uniref:VanZ family protein n=1 Tax=Fulvivirga sediminis TaxID=2803949 RepID=A0A937F5H4_9BACT|nr:VanZ family protein [Fulvivirga sediminis]MBL3655019.1 VanZ family protein [Fulvivirga sediminis]
MNIYLIGAFLWSLLILVLTLTPGESVPDVGLFDYDKLGHAFIFFVLSFLSINGIYRHPRYNAKVNKAVIIGVLFSAFYGFTIELIQSVIPGRSMEAMDAIANIIGAILGLSLFYLMNKLRT